VGLTATRARAAASWPSRPIRLIVPFPPAGSTDILAREIALSLQEALGQPVVVENRPGAGGSIGSTEAARAAADGYTLAMGHIGTLAINPSLYPKLAYDPRTSFTPVALIARLPNVLVVNPQVAAKDVRELIALAKARPGQLRYASGGNGSAAHLAMEYFKLKAGVDIVHVPYRGTAPAVTDVLAGHVEMIMTGVPAVQQQVKSGKLRARLASRTALAAMSAVPTHPSRFRGDSVVRDRCAGWNFGGHRRAPTTPRSTVRSRRINSRSGWRRSGAEKAAPGRRQRSAHDHGEVARWKVVERANMRPE
jgi:tripartite-type tricarboxylate transporter receptor subunit TctC